MRGRAVIKHRMFPPVRKAVGFNSAIERSWTYGTANRSR